MFGLGRKWSNLERGRLELERVRLEGVCLTSSRKKRPGSSLGASLAMTLVLECALVERAGRMNEWQGAVSAKKRSALIVGLTSLMSPHSSAATTGNFSVFSVNDLFANVSDRGRFEFCALLNPPCSTNPINANLGVYALVPFYVRGVGELQHAVFCCHVRAPPWSSRTACIRADGARASFEQLSRQRGCECSCCHDSRSVLAC